MKIFKFCLIPTLLLTIGCGHIQKQTPAVLENGCGPEGQKLFLSASEDQRSDLETFLSRHPEVSEESKIRYLLTRLERSEYSFIRNNENFDGPSAMKWLRWKRGHRQYRNEPIKKAHDFVDRVADLSRATGLPYEAVIDGKHYRLDSLLNNELEALEIAIQLRNVQKHVSENLPQGPKASSDLSSPVPIAGPSPHS